MKRQTAMALAAVFAMSVAGTALAAPANPFVDVPAKHWAYDSVNKLAQAGVISGYGDNTFKGDKTLTRYEIAVIVGKAMASNTKMDAETAKALQALKAEFGAELNNLGVRVENLEKKTDNVKVTGVIRARYDNEDVNNVTTMKQKFRTRVMIKGQINDQWAYTGRLENTQNLRTSGAGLDEDLVKTTTDETETDLNWAFVQGKIGNVGVTLGRFDATPAYGIALDDTVDAAMFSFGNKLKVDLLAGKQNFATTADRDNTYIANLGYKLSDKLNAKGAYFVVDPQANGADDVKLYEVGMDYQLTPTLNVKGVYLKSNTEEEDKGYFAQVAYKGANPAKAGSFGAWVSYRNLEENSFLSSTVDIDYVSAKTNGGKGYEVGFNYAPMKNAKWTTTYTDLKGTENDTLKGDYLRTQVEFYF